MPPNGNGLNSSREIRTASIGLPSGVSKSTRIRHAGRNQQDEPAGKASARLAGTGVFAALNVLLAIFGEGQQAAFERGAPDLMGDEQRLERRVGGRVGEAGLQHRDGAIEIGRDQPLALGRDERDTEVVGYPSSYFEEGLRNRSSE